MCTRQLVIAPSDISPQARETSSVWVLGSGAGSNLRALLLDSQKQAPYHIAGLICDRPCGCESLATDFGIPVHRLERRTDMNREDFDRQILATLNGEQVDFLVLAGYKRMVSTVLLDAYRDRIVNVHPGDLSVVDSNGRRLYTGLDAVRKAIDAGESHTRSCVINVTEAMDGGAVIVSGPRLLVRAGVTAQAHQEAQKAASDWPAVCTAMRLLSSKRARIGHGSVWIDGKLAGPAGLELQARRENSACVASLD